MYALVALLSLLVSGVFLAVFVQRRRGLRPVLAVALAALLYTHGWGIFLVAAAGCTAAVLTLSAPDRRAMALDAVLVFGAAGALFAPWVPTLLFQAAHTGAPWARVPGTLGLARAVRDVFGGPGPLCALVVAGAVALWRAPATDRRAAATLVVLGAGALLMAWGYARHTRAWSPRYFIVLVGPALLLGALVVSRARVAGVAALAVVALAWFGLPAYSSLARKSNIRTVAAALEGDLRRGDLVVAAQPDTEALLRYALGARYRYATPLGLTPDPTVMDWRDAVARLRAAGTRRVLALAHGLRPGARLAFIRPVTLSGFRAPWTRLVKLRAAQIARALRADRGLRRVGVIHPGRPGTRSTLRGVVYRRV
jgi:MFS family permease